MSTQEITYIMILAIPLYVSLICGLLHLRMYMLKDSILGRKPLRLAVMAYMISTFGWLAVIFYVTMPSVFVFLNPFLLAAFMTIHIIYYHFIFEMTKIYEEEKFPIIHYAPPFLLSISILIWSLFVPFEVQLSYIRQDGAAMDNYKLYATFFYSEPLVFFAWNIIYALFGLRRIMKFRKIIVNYSADEERTSLTWLYQFLLAMMTAIPMGLIAVLIPEGQGLPFWLIISFIIVVIFKDIIFAHNVLLDNFVLIRTDADDPAPPDDNTSGTVKREDIKRLEAYMLRGKPYLNPKLKITDITRELATNRTSLSLLINRTYGMNFSRYINRFRLQELEKVKKDPAYAGLSEVEQVIIAGFSDYRGYKRVKQREKDNLSLL